MTELFPPENYAGTVGATLDPNAIAGSAGTLSSGSGTATYQAFGDGTTWAKYLGQRSLIRDSLSLPQHIYLVMTLAANHTPTAGFQGPRLMNAIANTTVAALQFGTAGSINIQGLGDTNVDGSRPRFDFRTGSYVLVWDVDTLNGVQTLSIYSTQGFLIDKLTGACDTAPITRYREGVNSPGIADAQLFIRTTGITNSYVAPVFALKSLWVCNVIPGPTSFDVNVVTTGTDLVRLYVPSLGVTTDPQAPSAVYGVTSHTVSGLSPRTRYDYIVQGSLAGVWTAIDAGSSKTAPASLPGTPMSYRMGSLGCTGTNSTLANAWNHALLCDLDFSWNEGDWDYDNDESDDPAIYFWDYVNQMNGTPGMAAAYRQFSVFPSPSDHIWENNANTGGMQSTLAHDAAWRLLWPQYESPLVDEQGLCFAFTVGDGMRHLFWDFRNYYRSNSDDALVPYNSPQRKACGPKQLAWLEAEITNPAWRFVTLHSDPVPLSNPPHTPPYPPELQGKTDSLPSYTDFRDWLFGLLGDRASSFFWFGDYHAVSACSRSFSPLNGVALFGAAGTDQTFTYRNNDSNGAAIVGVYEQYWPPEASNNNLPIAVWGYVDYVDNVSSITVNATGWDVLTTPGTPIARVNLSETFVVGYDVFTLGGTVIDPVTQLPADGFLVLTPCDGDGATVSPIVDTGGRQVLAGAPTQVAFSNGQVSIPGLPNPSDTNLNPHGFGYKLQITTDHGGLLPEVIFTVAAGVTSLDISTVQPGSPDVVAIAQYDPAGAAAAALVAAEAYTDAAIAGLPPGGGGSGDVVSNVSSSVVGEVVVMDAIDGKHVRQASGSGLAKLNAGVLSIAVAGTDFLAPGGNGSGLTGLVESQIAGLVSDLAALAAGIGTNAAAIAARLVIANNLSEIASAGSIAQAAARTNLGLGSIATKSGTAPSSSAIQKADGLGGITPATSGTDYAPGTSGLATGLLKSTTGTGALSIAAAGTDYVAATTGSAVQKANGAGGLTPATLGTDYAPGTSALATGLVKSTTGLGTFSIAAAGTDYQAARTEQILNTTASINGGGGTSDQSMWAPANIAASKLSAGVTTYRVRFGGTFDNVSTSGAINAKLKANGTTIANVQVAISQTGAATNTTWWVDVDVYVDATGAGGSVSVQGVDAIISAAGGGRNSLPVQNIGQAVDLSTGIQFSIFGTFVTGNAGNILRIFRASIQQVA